MRVRFASPDTTTLQLSDGDWIKVKLQLGVGESRNLLTAGFKNVTGLFGASDAASLNQSTLRVDWVEQTIARVMAWVTDWSFLDTRGNRVPFNRETVCALDEETFAEIDAALDKHVEAIAEAKKQRAGQTESAPTSS